MSDMSLMKTERKQFHQALMDRQWTIDKQGIPTNADKSSKASIAIARGIIEICSSNGGKIQERLPGQTSGNNFEAICAKFVESTFLQFNSIRPGNWRVTQTGGRNRLQIAQYLQYQHLTELDNATKGNPSLAAILGSDYTITPDIIVSRAPVPDNEININSWLVDDESALQTGLRKKNSDLDILHASISCKWTMRSDRAQNSRSEALNLIRNRKGHLPHIAAVTGEPLPSRIASLALGTGDIDCVYHFALYELIQSVEAQDHLGDSHQLLQTLVQGSRLKDISDLPLDLAT